jgi:trans-aconitate methyltransferase
MMHQVKKMLLRDSDVEWEKFGRTDPYYGVLSCERFHIDKMDDDSLADFFESGQRQIDFILETIRSSIDPEFAPRRALDFGCGVGRCAIALARACETVTGVDVSNSMLREAEKRSAEQSIKNLRFLQSADDLSCLAGQFDLIHSSLVFQHINQKRGMRIFARLVDLLSDNGVGAVQFIYDRSESALVRQMGNLRRAIPVWHPIVNLLYGKPASEPLMEKNVYDVNQLLTMLCENGCSKVHLRLFKFPNRWSTIIFFQKNQEEAPYNVHI